jgi:hypothetical protein
MSSGAAQHRTLSMILALMCPLSLFFWLLLLNSSNAKLGIEEGERATESVIIRIRALIHIQLHLIIAQPQCTLGLYNSWVGVVSKSDAWWVAAYNISSVPRGTYLFFISFFDFFFPFLFLFQ